MRDGENPEKQQELCGPEMKSNILELLVTRDILVYHPFIKRYVRLFSYRIFKNLTKYIHHDVFKIVILIHYC